MFEKIKEIIVDQLGVEESEVKLETSFESDLEADSLDIFQVINEIEDEFDITIDTDQDLKTVGDLVTYVEGLEK
ncbi:acyl carrier protein [Aerococcaceae bacterium DSM 111021]|nr:acyl carrier protein [Aerococcaceae bacterium DSM 111021]